MHTAEPKVFLVARPSINWAGVNAYLKSVDGLEHYERMGEWDEPDSTPASKLVEFMGRLCYRSWKPLLNKNVTKVREDRNRYLANVIGSAHGSVMEHAMYSFVFADVSRVLTHELVRHRAGTAFSQESLRYVRLDDLGFEHPDIFPDTLQGDELRSEATELLEAMEHFQVRAAEVNQLDEPGDFHRKKAITSGMRRYAPDGLATTIGFSANIRALRWMIEQRTDISAEQEIRRIFDQVGRIMIGEEPDLFQDFTVNAEREWKPTVRKV
jgi:thymidylate synthase (FAD)